MIYRECFLWQSHISMESVDIFNSGLSTEWMKRSYCGHAFEERLLLLCHYELSIIQNHHFGCTSMLDIGYLTIQLVPIQLFQVTGDFNKMLALQRLLEPYGICEVCLFAHTSICGISKLIEVLFLLWVLLLNASFQFTLSCPYEIIGIYIFRSLGSIWNGMGFRPIYVLMENIKCESNYFFVSCLESWMQRRRGWSIMQDKYHFIKFS